MSDLKNRIGDATKVAMKARDKARVAALRLINAEIKRVEVDERRELSDTDVVNVMNRMLKQRRDSLGHYEQAGRTDLADQEHFEIAVIDEFMPAAVDEAEIETIVARVVAETGASSMKDMGSVMGVLKTELAGRADMAQVSARVKEALTSS